MRGVCASCSSSRGGYCTAGAKYGVIDTSAKNLKIKNLSYKKATLSFVLTDNIQSHNEYKLVVLMKHELSLRTVPFDLPFSFFIPLVVSCEDERRRVKDLCLMKEGEASMVLQTFVPYCILLRVCMCARAYVCMV